MESSVPGGGRRKKTARERREQRRRADARLVQRILSSLDHLSRHRGCQPTVLGSALAAMLRGSTPATESTTPAPASDMPSFQGSWFPLPRSHSDVAGSVAATSQQIFDSFRFSEEVLAGSARSAGPSHVLNPYAPSYTPSQSTYTVDDPQLRGDDVLELPGGSRVRAIGLISRQELNSCVGTIQFYSVDRDRYAVKFDTEAHSVFMKRANLQLVI